MPEDNKSLEERKFDLEREKFEWEKKVRKPKVSWLAIIGVLITIGQLGVSFGTYQNFKEQRAHEDTMRLKTESFQLKMSQNAHDNQMSIVDSQLNFQNEISNKTFEQQKKLLELELKVDTLKANKLLAFENYKYKNDSLIAQRKLINEYILKYDIEEEDDLESWMLPLYVAFDSAELGERINEFFLSKQSRTMTSNGVPDITEDKPISGDSIISQPTDRQYESLYTSRWVKPTGLFSSKTYYLPINIKFNIWPILLKKDYVDIIINDSKSGRYTGNFMTSKQVNRLNIGDTLTFEDDRTKYKLTLIDIRVTGKSPTRAAFFKAEHRLLN